MSLDYSKKELVSEVKGKALTALAWTGPEGSGRLRSPDFKKIGA